MTTGTQPLAIGGAEPAKRRWQRVVPVTLAGSAVLVIWVAYGWRSAEPVSAFGAQPAVIAQGERLYAAHCASCHGRDLEGQPEWQSPRADGMMPAPPHNSDGHTWHHDSATLLGITRSGLVPPWAPPGYRSDMPAFAGVLSDAEIWATLAFIASTWSEEAKGWQRQIETQAGR